MSTAKSKQPFEAAVVPASIATEAPKVESRLEGLIRTKVQAGLSLEMATECAKNQIAEDDSGIYAKVRKELSGNQ